jgi:hypothetical protein
LELLGLLAQRSIERHGVAYEPTELNRLKEAFVEDAILELDWMQSVNEFLWWLVRAGLAVELTFGKRRSGAPHVSSPIDRTYPGSMRLTRRGARLIDGDDDNPALPGYLDRVRDRCPGLPDGVIALLVDARACLDHSLLRAAVVLMGVAYEIAIGEVVNKLDPLGIFDVKKLPERLPAEKIRAMLVAIRTDKVPALTSLSGPAAEAAKRAAVAAYDFADTLRQRRNEASHLQPLHDFDHGGETEEFLVSAGRHLTGLWMVGEIPSPVVATAAP